MPQSSQEPGARAPDGSSARRRTASDAPVVANKRPIRPLIVALLSSGLALAVYVRTMAPTITFSHDGADSGDLVTAAINLGVPHPTGYPLYTLVAHVFTRLPGEPARNVNLLSALCGALAVGVVFWAAYRLIATRDSGGPLALVAAFSAAGVFAFGRLLWSQATIAEVYSLNALWAGAMLAALLASGPRKPYVLAFLCGIGLAHHLTAIWVLPAMWPYTGAVRRWLTLRRTSILLLCFLPGPLTYLYIPLRARAHPVPNWGLASDLSGFIWLVSGQPYHRYLGRVVPVQLVQRLAAWAGIWVRDLGVIGLGLALLGLWRSLERDRRFSAFGLTWLGLLTAYSILYTTVDSYLYLLPAAAMAAMWMGWGAYVVLRELSRLDRGARRVQWVAIVVLLALPLLAAVSGFGDLDLSSDHQAYISAANLLEAAEPNALILSRGDTQTFSLWYVRYGLQQRPDVVTVDRWLLALPWYRADLAARNSELAGLLQTRDDQEAAAMLLAIGGRPVQLAYQDDQLLQHGEWTKMGLFYTLVQ